MCGFWGLKVLKARILRLFFLRHKAEIGINPWLPCVKGAGAERLKESARLAVFRRFSVPRAPFVTLPRDTFLPEEGS